MAYQPLQQRSSTAEATTATLDEDIDAEHDPERARRVSNAALRDYAAQHGVSATSSSEVAPASALKVGAGGANASAAETASQRAAAPPEVQFGDLEVNETKHQLIYVFNQHPESATVSAHIEGSSALALASKPDRLRPSREGFDPNAGFDVWYRPTSSAVDDSVLVVTLSWRDGKSETVRIKVRAAAHKRSEPTHAEQAAEAAEAKRRSESKKEQDKIAAQHEAKVQEAEKRPGGIQPPIDFAFHKLMNAAEELFSNQEAGVRAAGDKVSEFKRRQAAAQVKPPIALQLASLALSLATRGLSSLLEAGFDELKPTGKFKQWEKGTTINVSSSVIDGVKSAVGFAIGKGEASIANHLTWKPQNEDDSPTSAETRIDFFTAQSTALNAAVRERKDHLVDVERALLPLNTPELAGMAAFLLDQLAATFRKKAAMAARSQEYETTRQWARFLSHVSLGSVEADEAKEQGLAPMRDGSPTANTKKALLTSGPHDGLLDIEFSADYLHPGRPIQLTHARLFGLHEASVKVLKLDKLPLGSSMLPIRLRSNSGTSPLAVTITCDEAGNVAYSDESGAVGMPSPWLSRRGGGRGDASAHRAAKALIESVRTKSLTQLGVSLELDNA